MALVFKTDNVCGNISSETKNLTTPALTAARSLTANKSARASAAEVLSSKSEAFASSIPVKSVTMVWKFSSASKRPWAISA